MNILQMGLNAQKLTVEANKRQLTDSDVKSINDAGLRVVSRPESVVSNALQEKLAQQEKRRKMFCTSPEAA